MNYINYVKHAVYTPDVYHRSFEKDLPEEESLVKRVALVALPFIGLYKPAGSVISIGMGSVRTYTHLSAAIESNSIGDVAQTAFAILALTSSVFNYSTGILVVNGIDTLQGLIQVLTHLLQKEWNLAANEALQVAINSIYLAFLLTNSLEFIFVFTVMQVLASIVQTRDELLKGRFLEAFAKTAMGALRAKQGYDYYQLIQRRNILFELKQYQTLIHRAKRGREVRDLIEHPLMDKADGSFHGFGKHLVKGENITIREKESQGSESIEIQFKVNHAFRDKIQDLIQEISLYDCKETREILSHTGSHATDIKLKKGDFFSEKEKDDIFFWGGSFSEAHRIEMTGLGSIFIGSSPESINLYDRVVIQLPKGSNLFDFHEIMAFLNIDEALRMSTVADIERLKLGHLYRTFFPRDALTLERSEEFFALPLIDLQEKIFSTTPAMRDVYEAYFHQMIPDEIFAGKVRYKIPGLAEKSRELGARALTAAILGSYGKDEELYARVESILNTGLLSTETRYDIDLDSHGLGGSGIDFYTGGADSVFTQMITKRNCDNETYFQNFAYNSKVRLLIDLEAVEMGTYQYVTDSFGNRIVDDSSFWWWGQTSYKDRLNILEFTESLETSRYNYFANEVMLKERLKPSWIKTIIVPDQKTHDSLSAYLSKQDRKFSADFIRIGDKITEELITT